VAPRKLIQTFFPPIQLSTTLLPTWLACVSIRTYRKQPHAALPSRNSETGEQYVSVVHTLVKYYLKALRQVPLYLTSCRHESKVSIVSALLNRPRSPGVRVFTVPNLRYVTLFVWLKRAV
jgi:hypothetical protein